MSTHLPDDTSRVNPCLHTHTFLPKYASTTQFSSLPHGCSSSQVKTMSDRVHPPLNGSPLIPLGHWHVKPPGVLMQSDPSGQTGGICLHSSSSTQPPIRSAEPTKPGAHKHFASWLTIIQLEFGPQERLSHGWRQSFPIFGVGHKQRWWSSQMALPGQSLFDLHVTTVIQRTLGSGSGIEPSGQIHSNDPARFKHNAPWPQRFGFEHSSISKNWQNPFILDIIWFSSNFKYFHFFCIQTLNNMKSIAWWID